MDRPPDAALGGECHQPMTSTVDRFNCCQVEPWLRDSQYDKWHDEAASAQHSVTVDDTPWDLHASSKTSVDMALLSNTRCVYIIHAWSSGLLDVLWHITRSFGPGLSDHCTGQMASHLAWRPTAVSGAAHANDGFGSLDLTLSLLAIIIWYTVRRARPKTRQVQAGMAGARASFTYHIRTQVRHVSTSGLGWLFGKPSISYTLDQFPIFLAPTWVQSTVEDSKEVDVDREVRAWRFKPPLPRLRTRCGHGTTAEIEQGFVSSSSLVAGCGTTCGTGRLAVALFWPSLLLHGDSASAASLHGWRGTAGGGQLEGAAGQAGIAESYTDSRRAAIGARRPAEWPASRGSSRRFVEVLRDLL
ncbi:hypothetical protein P280DRAFT_483256 [Massarina eburnea CBS 473.64]|uniref:Uncharacterized protein n=1 Tax=Massarina eburnea CBS 473.64 TaxID=1395130 RepID=A0A6A6RS06_9PLEO|nr:hypothetical protein P280DRAFT_483256 [Massarina eburnea CBS 473.64]